MKFTRCFFIIFTILLYVNVCSVFAKAPNTPKILFTSLRDGNPEIYVMNPDGTEQVNLTRHRAADSDPVWSPTGEQILFVSNRNKTNDLYLMDADGGNVRKVFIKTARRQRPTWAPNGNKIAYYSVNVARGEMDIYIGSINGAVEEPVVSGIAPTWAPDNSEIAFIASDVFIPLGDEHKGIVLAETRFQFVNPRTHHVKKLTLPGFFYVFDPVWSPNSTKIAFTGIDLTAILPEDALKDDHNLLDEKAIYVMNRNGSGVQLIVDADGADLANPAWAPSGDVLVYQRRVGEERQLFKVTLSDGISEQLTHVGSNTNANWFDPMAGLPVSPQPQLLTTIWGELKK